MMRLRKGELRMKMCRQDKGVEIDALKFLEWSEGKNLADVGGVIKLLGDAIENNDVKFLRRFPWIGKRISREVPA